MMKKHIYLLAIGCCLALCYYSCKKQDDEFVINKGLKADDIIQITAIKPSTLFADSSSKLVVRVQVNANTDTAVQVSLSTSSGLINSKSKSETMRVNVNRYVDFILTAGRTPGPISLRASVLNTYFRDTVLNFNKSYPDTILVYPEAYNIAKNSSVAASIHLIRKTGFPSAGQTIFLTAMDPDGNNLGRFTYAGSFTPGTALSASFTPPLDYVGNITLQANVITADNLKIIGKSTINIQ